MAKEPTYSDVAEKAGISPSYAHQIISGARKPPLHIALRIFDATGFKFGGLDGLSKRDIEAVRKAAA